MQETGIQFLLLLAELLSYGHASSSLSPWATRTQAHICIPGQTGYKTLNNPPETLSGLSGLGVLEPQGL